MEKKAEKKFVWPTGSNIQVILPKTKNSDGKTDTAKYIDELKAVMDECFGGTAVDTAIAYWPQPMPGVKGEPSIILESNCPDQVLEDNFDKVLQKCMEIKPYVTDDKIAIEINGRTNFI